MTMEDWTINEEQANKILETNPITITESNVFNDLDITKEERIKRATRVLRNWRKVQTEEE